MNKPGVETHQGKQRVAQAPSLKIQCEVGKQRQSSSSSVRKAANTWCSAATTSGRRSSSEEGARCHRRRQRIEGFRHFKFSCRIPSNEQLDRAPSLAVEPSAMISWLRASLS